MTIKIKMKVQVWKVLLTLLACNTLFAVAIGIHFWRIGSSPVGGFIYSFILQLWGGFWVYAMNIFLYYLLITLIKIKNVYLHIIISAGIGCLVSVCFGIYLRKIDFYDIKGFPFDIIGYTLVGALYGWLHAEWLTKSKQVITA